MYARKTNVEEDIFEKETAYLENTLGGNIITGFDSYTKGASSAAAQRRKTGLTEANRVFSRSSISYNANSVFPPLSRLPSRALCAVALRHRPILERKTRT